jgi:hypothetical protein
MKEGIICPPRLCLLCGRRGCVRADAGTGPEAVRYECPAHCGSFRIGSAFLHYVWPAVKKEDQQALTAYARHERAATGGAVD